jgi:hypothetical protein
MKLVFTLLVLGTMGYGAFWALQKNPQLQTKVQELIPTGEFHTLEVRYTAEQIMESHKKDLLKSHRHKYLETKLCFYPYLLMEVKYSVNTKKTEESLILWDLYDGEMVLETKDWEKTHGFGDCISAEANRHEFKVINFLAKKGGISDRQGLLSGLHLENDTLDALIESLRRKQILVLSGSHYRLHIQKPNLKATPTTKISERLVTKTSKNAQKVAKRFSLSQVERLAKAAFGDEFVVRHTSDVYLPVHSISVQNPDGSIHTSLWNALNGKRIIHSYGN